MEWKPKVDFCFLCPPEPELYADTGGERSFSILAQIDHEHDDGIKQIQSFWIDIYLIQENNEPTSWNARYYDFNNGDCSHFRMDTTYSNMLKITRFDGGYRGIMEVENYDYQTSKFFNLDGPMYGANFPLGMQYMAHHVSNIGVPSWLQGTPYSIKLKDLIPGFAGLDKLLNSMALRQQAQDTYYVGTIKGVGRIYQQTFIDTYTRVADVKLYDRKNALVAADILNDRVLPFYEAHEVKLLRILTDRGTEYCGRAEHHEFELYLNIEDIDHSRTQASSPQTNGICERFHRTMQEEFYATAFRKKIYNSLEELQNDVDQWLSYYNKQRPHSGRYCYGKTPYQTFIDSIPLAKAKQLNEQFLTADTAGNAPLEAAIAGGFPAGADGGELQNQFTNHTPKFQ